MNKGCYSQWRGFEIAPKGCLLEQFIDLSGPMGIAYERCIEFYKDFHSHDRLMLVFPRGASAMEIRTKTPPQKFLINSREFLIVPAEQTHDDEGVSAIYDTVALYPESELIKNVCVDFRISQKNLRKTISRFAKLNRSLWLEQLVQHYFYLRISQKNPDTHIFYLEQAIVREVFSIFWKLNIQTENKDQIQELNLSDENPNTALKALRFIEANLFSNLSNDKIAKFIGASESDLLRKFKVATKTTPHTYIKNRRLEEAKLLLENSDYPIGQIALLVGYNNFGAFSEAFKTKFKTTPSALVKKGNS
jgi:AraC-like DNA-binding protein